MMVVIVLNDLLLGADDPCAEATPRSCVQLQLRDGVTVRRWHLKPVPSRVARVARLPRKQILDGFPDAGRGTCLLAVVFVFLHDMALQARRLNIAYREALDSQTRGGRGPCSDEAV